MSEAIFTVFPFSKLTDLVRIFNYHHQPSHGISDARKSCLRIEVNEALATLDLRYLFRFVPKRQDIPSKAHLNRAIRSYVRHHFPGVEWCEPRVNDKQTGPENHHPISPASFVRMGANRHEF